MPPSWAWAKALSYVNGSAANQRVAKDGWGNIYVAGIYTRTIHIDDSVYTSVTGSKQNIYLIKYDSTGNVLWSKNIPANDNAVPTALAVDAVTADIYLAGNFNKAIVLDDSTFTSSGQDDFFLVKYKTNGVCQWKKTFGDKYYDEVCGMAVDNWHNVVLCGGYGALNMKLGSIILTCSLKDSTDRKYFVAKCDSAGNFIWAKGSSDQRAALGRYISIDKHDNLVVCGIFNYQIKFDSINLQWISAGFISGDHFLVKYDSAGNALWAGAIGGINSNGFHGSSPAEVDVTALTTDSAGNTIIGGYNSECAVTFGSYALPQKDLFSKDMWFAKYSASGSFVWAKQAWGDGEEMLTDLTCDKQGGIYLTGTYNRPFTFETDSAYIPLLFSSFYSFVTKCDTSGNVRWIKPIGGPDDAGSGASVVSEPDEVVSVGGFGSNAGVLLFDTTRCYDYGAFNSYVARLTRRTYPSVVAPSLVGYTIGVSPNPANSFLCLKNDRSKVFSHYQLYDLIGQKVTGGTLGKVATQTINLPDLQDGIYYLMLNGDTAQFVQKVQIVH